MQDYDRGFKEVSRRIGRVLARMARIESDSWRPLVSEVQAAERFADRVFLARRAGERFVVYFEAYTRWSRDAPWNVMTKAALLAERERLPVMPVLFVLTPPGYESQGGRFRLEAQGELTQEIRFREVLLWEMEPGPDWEAVPTLMTLFPLCRHGLRPCDAVVRAAGTIREQVPAGLARADELFLLNIFSRLAYRRLKTADLIGREELMASSFGQELIHEGLIRGQRGAVLGVLTDRFGADAARPVSDPVNAIEDFDQLRTLLRAAALCADLDEFRRALPPARRRRRRS